MSALKKTELISRILWDFEAWKYLFWLNFVEIFKSKFLWCQGRLRGLAPFKVSISNKIKKEVLNWVQIDIETKSALTLDLWGHFRLKMNSTHEKPRDENKIWYAQESNFQWWTGKRIWFESHTGTFYRWFWDVGHNPVTFSHVDDFFIEKNWSPTSQISRSHLEDVTNINRFPLHPFNCD